MKISGSIKSQCVMIGSQTKSHASFSLASDPLHRSFPGQDYLFTIVGVPFSTFLPLCFLYLTTTHPTSSALANPFSITVIKKHQLSRLSSYKFSIRQDVCQVYRRRCDARWSCCCSNNKHYLRSQLRRRNSEKYVYRERVGTIKY